MMLREIETFLSAHDIPATKFGRMAAGDPRLVPDLRMGRTVRRDTEIRLKAWMKGYAACCEHKLKGELT